jgi:hypothetical protein
MAEWDAEEYSRPNVEQMMDVEVWCLITLDGDGGRAIALWRGVTDVVLLEQVYRRRPNWYQRAYLKRRATLTPA